MRVVLVYLQPFWHNSIWNHFLCVITCFTCGQNLDVLTSSYTGDWKESLNSRVGYRTKQFADAWNRSSSTFYLLPCTCVYVYTGQCDALRGATLWMIQTCFAAWNRPKNPLNPLFWRSRSFKDIEFGANWEPVYDFLLVLNSNIGLMSHRYRETVSYRPKIANFAYPTHLVPSFGVTPL